MATGDPVIVGLYPQPPGADAAALDFRVGGSTPGEVVELYAFDAAAIEYLDLIGVVSLKYTGANLSLIVPWMAATATANNVKWDAAVRRLNSSTDMDAAHVYSFQTVTATTQAAAGRTSYTTIGFTQAQANSMAAGDVVIVRLKRDATNAADTMAGDAQVLAGQVLVAEA